MANRIEKADQEAVLVQIRRKWNCLGHMLRNGSDCIAEQVLQWTPHGHRKEADQKTSGEEILWSKK